MSDSVTLLQGGRVVSADGEVDADVLIVGEQIAAVGAVSAPEGAEIVDVGGCLLLPGLIDNHTHLSMPFMGMMSADDYDTGTQAAAAGGVTCLVDFAIQREPDNLTSALEEWQGRAAGAAHVDYGFHMAITNANEPTIEDMASMVDAGVTSFKLFMAYKGELMTRDDALAATMERARDLRCAGDDPRRERRPGRPVRAPRAARGRHRRDLPRAHPPRVRRGRGDRPRGADRASTPARHAVRRARHLRAAAAEIEAAQQRGAKVTGETCTQYLVNTIDDLRKRDRHRPALHLLAAAARRGQPRAAVAVPAPRRAGVRSRPTTARSTASRRRAATTTSASCPTACR